MLMEMTTTTALLITTTNITATAISTTTTTETTTATMTTITTTCVDGFQGKIVGMKKVSEANTLISTSQFMTLVKIPFNLTFK